MPTKTFDVDDFRGFLKLLPKSIDGRPIRHAVEVRHDSFKSPEFIGLVREHEVAIVVAADADYPQIADMTAPFVYVRIMGTRETEAIGYAKKAIDAWVERTRQWAAGKAPREFTTVLPPLAAKRSRCDVFLYVISGFKVRNPAAAMAMIERLR